MGFKCLNEEGNEVYSFNFEKDEWLLEKSKKKSFKYHDNTPAVLKTSKNGVQFFSRKNGSDAEGGGGESAEHLRIKWEILKHIKKHNNDWKIQAEYQSESPDGSVWIADIYLTKGSVKIAVEVQLSPQSYSEYLRRTEVYRSSGVRVLWLAGHKRPSIYDYEFKINKNLPVFEICRDSSIVTLGKNSIHVTEFVSGALNRKLSYDHGFIEGDEVNVVFLTSDDNCWKCKSNLNNLRYIEICFTDKHGDEESHTIDISNIDVSMYPELNKFLNLRERNRRKPSIRYSKSTGSNYIGSTCSKCNALQGKFFTQNYWDCFADEEIEITLEGGWIDTVKLLLQSDSFFKWYFLTSNRPKPEMSCMVDKPANSGAL